MSKKLLLLIAILVIALLVYALSSDEYVNLEMEPVQLRLRMQPGDWVKVKLTEQSHFKEKQFMVGMYFNGTVEMEITMKCTGRDDDGVMAIEQTWDAMRLSLVSSSGNVEYDSRESDKAAPAGARQFEAIVGKTVTFKVTPEGDLLDYQGAEQIAGALLIDVKKPKPSGDRKTRQMLKEAGLLGLDPFKKDLANGLVESRQFVLPSIFRWYAEDELTVGQSWTTIGRCMADRRGDETMVMKYEGTHGGQVYLDVEAAVEAGDSLLDQLQFQGVQAASFGNSLSMSGQGRFCVDIKTGLIREGKIEGTAKMLMPRGLAGQLWDSSEKRVLNGTIKTELKTLEEYLQ